MKNVFKILVFTLLCIGQTSCFILTRPSTTVQTNTLNAMEQMLVKSWRFQEAYNVVNAQVYDRISNGSYWIRFYADGTCYENGFLGTGGNQELQWNLSGNVLRIRGRNLVYGELSGSEVVYTIESISENRLQLSRWNGRSRNGTDIIRQMIFRY